MAEVQHLPGQHKFVIQQDGEEDAVLAYRLSTQGDKASVDFYSTYVPPALRGKGLAEKLVYCGLKWAKEQGFHIEASCWYVAKFIR
ncbi:GNAT family N-acetyltransferase [Cellvibrio mixtus]|uniref:GNAT family N-acetyltransferase n=1 Tax=Cellvibrio mixtus TaxID=39650 RepID=UPI0005869AAB|nr:GNAT family N-acetyltransferase [Cellvibrio mixtus]